MRATVQARLPYLGLALLIWLLDRASKWVVDAHFDLGESRAVIDGFFNLTYVQNTGVAFGLFSSATFPAKVVVLAGFALGAALLVAVYSLRSPAGARLLQSALALILAGALGNLYDRVAYGSVIDFLDLHIRGHHWPAFNVADAAITTGVFLLVLDLFRSPDEA